jgi:uncharacterized protein YpmS
MKQIILTLLALFTAFIVWFIIFTSQPTHKYRIVSENQGHRTNKYEIVSPNCVKFVNAHNQTITICGEYEIIEY